MPLTRGILIYSSAGQAVVTGAALPIAIIGIASNATVANNIATKVTSAADALAKFGAHAAGDTIPRTLDVLLRYGCNNIYVIKVQDAAGIIGSDTAGARTGLYLIKDIPSLFNQVPAFILAPGQNNDAVVTAMVAVADSIRSYAVVSPNDGDSINTVVAARAGATGIGQDKERLIVAYPFLINAVTSTIREPLSTHLVGAVARSGSYGRTVSSLKLLGVNAPSVALSVSLTDENSDVNKMINSGCITIVPSDDEQGSYETWGDRNTLFPSDTGIRSFITAIRTEDAVMQLAVARARKFIDEPSTVITATLATASYNAMFTDMIFQGNLRSGSAEWDESESDLSLGKLKHALRFQINNSVTLMEAAVTIGG